MFFVSLFSWSRCSFKHPSTFLISLNSNCRPAGTCLHVNNFYLGCQPHLTKESLHVSQRGWCQHVTSRCRPYLTIPTKIRPLTGPTPADTGRDGGGAGREEWQHWCIIHLFIIPHYSPLIIPSPQKPVCPLFFCLRKCHLSERDWDGEEEKGHIFSLNFDFLHSCQYCVLHFFLIGPNEHIAHTVRGQQVWSCTALPHRVALCVSKKSVGSMGNVLGDNLVVVQIYSVGHQICSSCCPF